jgi:hypothetical protein
MGRACIMLEVIRNVLKVLVRTPERKGTFGRLRHRWEIILK